MVRHAGIVTLAAALALPDGVRGAARFPIAISFSSPRSRVVLGTLVLQGMTLPPLMRALALEDDGSVEREVRLARAETARAALDAVDGGGERERDGRVAPPEVRRRGCSARRAGTVRRRRSERLARVTRDVQRRAQAAERRTLSDLRAPGVIGDDAFHRVEEELDWAEVNAEARSGTTPGDEP